MFSCFIGTECADSLLRDTRVGSVESRPLKDPAVNVGPSCQFHFSGAHQSVQRCVSVCQELDFCRWQRMMTLQMICVKCTTVQPFF